MEKFFRTCVEEIHRSLLGPNNPSIVDDQAIAFLRESFQRMLRLIHRRWERAFHRVGDHAIRDSISEIFPEELVKHMFSEANQAMGGRPLTLSLSEFNTILDFEAQPKAKLFVTAALQYILEELLELSQMADPAADRFNESRNVTERSIERAIHKDNDLRALFSTLAVQDFLSQNEATAAADLLFLYKEDIEADSIVYVPDDVALKFVAEHLDIPDYTILESPVLLKMLKYAVNPEGFTIVENRGHETIDGLDVLHVLTSNSVTYKILDGLLGKGNDLNEIVESQDFKEIVDGWDEGDQDPSRFLEIIRKRHLNTEDATYVFANYMNHNKLTKETVDKFIALGVDLNAVSAGYWTDSHNDNALSAAAEYRKVKDIRILLDSGAVLKPGSDLIESLVYGHSASSLDLSSQEEVDEIAEGLAYLTNWEAGQAVTQEIIDHVREEFTDNEFKEQLLDILQQYYDI
jgi:hypothetical protein